MPEKTALTGVSIPEVKQPRSKRMLPFEKEAPTPKGVQRPFIPVSPDALIPLAPPSPAVAPSIPRLEPFSPEEVDERIQTVVNTFRNKYNIWPDPGMVWDLATNSRMPRELLPTLFPDELRADVLQKFGVGWDYREEPNLEEFSTLIAGKQSATDVSLLDVLKKPSQGMLEKFKQAAVQKNWSMADIAIYEGAMAVAKYPMTWIGTFLQNFERLKLGKKLPKTEVPGYASFVWLINESPEFAKHVSNIAFLTELVFKSVLVPLKGALKALEWYDDKKNRVAIATFVAGMLEPDVPILPSLTPFSMSLGYEYRAKKEKSPFEFSFGDFSSYLDLWREAYEKSKGMSFANVVFAQYGWTADKYPISNFLTDLSFHIITDMPFTYATSLATRPIISKGKVVLSQHIPWIEDVSHWAAKETNPYRIRKFLSLPKGKAGTSLGMALAKTKTAKEVADLLSDNIAVHGGRIHPGDIRLMQLIKYKIADSLNFTKLPLEIQGFFASVPPRIFNVGARNAPEYAEDAARILGLDDPEDWAAKVMAAADDVERRAIFDRMQSLGKKKFGSSRWEALRRSFAKAQARFDREGTQAYLPGIVKIGDQEFIGEVSIVTVKQAKEDVGIFLEHLGKELKRAKPEIKESIEETIAKFSKRLEGLKELPDNLSLPVPFFTWQLEHNFAWDIPLEIIGRARAWTGRLADFPMLSSLSLLQGQLDAVTRYWRWLVLHKPATLFRIALDEPIRMLSMGMNPLNLFRETRRKELMDELGIEDLRFRGDVFYRMGHTDDYIIYNPETRYDLRILRTWLKEVGNDPITKAYFRGGKPALREHFLTTEVGQRMVQMTYRDAPDTLTRYIDQIDEFFQHLMGLDSRIANYIRGRALGKKLKVPSLAVLKAIPRSRKSLPVFGGPSPFSRGRPTLLDKYIGEKTIEEWTFLPLSAAMTEIREEMYINFYKRELDRLKQLSAKGLMKDQPIEYLKELASDYALDMVEKSTYQATRTLGETALRVVAPFLSAYREFFRFWAGEVARRPSRMLAYYRLQKTPEEAEIQTPIKLATALGLNLEGFSFKVFPRTISFITGGTGMPGENWFAQNWPGFGPVITFPVAVAATIWPEAWVPRWETIRTMPGLSFARPGAPMVSATERLLWAFTGLLRGVVSGDLRGIDLPWPIGRDPEVRKRAINMLIKMQAMKRGDINVKEAIGQIWGKELVNAIWGYLSPLTGIAQHEESMEMMQARGAFMELQDMIQTGTKVEKKFALEQMEKLYKMFPVYINVDTYFKLPQGKEREEYLKAHPKILPYITGYTARAQQTLPPEGLTDYQIQKLRGLAKVIEPEAFALKLNARYRSVLNQNLLSPDEEQELAEMTSPGVAISLEAIEGTRRLFFLRHAWESLRREVDMDDREALREVVREQVEVILVRDIIAGRRDEAGLGWRKFHELWVSYWQTLDDMDISPQSTFGRQVDLLYRKGVRTLRDDYPAFNREYMYTPEGMWRLTG